MQSRFSPKPHTFPILLNPVSNTAPREPLTIPGSESSQKVMAADRERCACSSATLRNTARQWPPTNPTFPNQSNV